MDLSQLPTGWVIVLWFGIIGACVGSFVNVVCYRLPIMKRLGPDYADGNALQELIKRHGKFNLSVPRSACPCCAAPIKAKHNIPVLGWLLLRGKCASCSCKIIWTYPAVELLFAGTFAVHAWFEGLYLAGVLTLPMMAIAFCGFWIYRKTQRMLPMFGYAFVLLFAAQAVLTMMGFSAYA